MPDYDTFVSNLLAGGGADLWPTDFDVRNVLFDRNWTQRQSDGVWTADRPAAVAFRPVGQGGAIILTMRLSASKASHDLSVRCGQVEKVLTVLDLRPFLVSLVLNYKPVEMLRIQFSWDGEQGPFSIDALAIGFAHLSNLEERVGLLEKYSAGRQF